MQSNIKLLYNRFQSIYRFTFQLFTSDNKNNLQLKNKCLIPKPPKRPLNSYQLFSQALTKQIRQKFPQEPNSIIVKKIATLWKDERFMPEYKNELELKSKQNQDNYKIEKDNYEQKYISPKRPINSFLRYVDLRRKQLKEEIKDKSLPDIMQIIVNEWNSKVTIEQKQQLDQEYKEELIKYQANIKRYKDAHQLPQRKRTGFNYFIKKCFENYKIDNLEKNNIEKQIDQSNNSNKNNIKNKKLKLGKELHKKLLSQFGDQWKAMSKVEKDKFTEMANQQNQKFNEKKQQFYESHGISQKDVQEIKKPKIKKRGRPKKKGKKSVELSSTVEITNEQPNISQPIKPKSQKQEI